MFINFQYSSPEQCAKELTLKEIKLSLTDSAQLLSNAINLSPPSERSGLVGPYPIYFQHHPYTKWVLKHPDNYFWLLNYFCELSERYTELKLKENEREEHHKTEQYQGLFTKYLAQTGYIMGSPSLDSLPSIV